MAIFSDKMLKYVTDVFAQTVSAKAPTYFYDPLWNLADYCISGEMPDNKHFRKALLNKVCDCYTQEKLLGIIRCYFDNHITENIVSRDVERKLWVMKTGLNALPVTKAVKLFQGFGINLTHKQIRKVFLSYGLMPGQKKYFKAVDFHAINRRVQGLEETLNGDAATRERINRLFGALYGYISNNQTNIKYYIPPGMKKSLFLAYLRNLSHYGVLGLFDARKSAFRTSKINNFFESQIIIDKIQHPGKSEPHYLNYLKSNGIDAKRGSINTIFKRWNVEEFQSAYKSNLQRLQEEYIPAEEQEYDYSYPDYERYIDKNYLYYLRSLKTSSVRVDAPGLFVLWYYLERLGIFHIFEDLRLTKYNTGQSWADFFLFTVGRIFYGLDTYQAGCRHEEPSIGLFASMLKVPGLTYFLKRLSEIEESQVFFLQKWLIRRQHELGLSQGKRIIYDFKQIDLDVSNPQLRNFGKGPSPVKKICYSGFRPHIAWDSDTQTLLVADFRKSSARGTSTFRRFTEEFLKPEFSGIFQEVFIDSEYTGKSVWNYIMDNERGMGAHLTGCLKQNNFVKAHRNRFIVEHENTDNFWLYWDKEHVYSSKTFVLEWPLKNEKTAQETTLTLNCIVKKNIKNGKYRCFGSSYIEDPKKIIEHYTHRWKIENGIKDLVNSYYLQRVPGVEDVNMVNLHFFIVSVCRTLYRMIERDIGDALKNSDETIKSLKTMRDMLFRQGSGQVFINDDTIEINYHNRFSISTTEMLKRWYEKINTDQTPLKIIGGFKLKFNLMAPKSEVKNSGEPRLLNAKKF